MGELILKERYLAVTFRSRGRKRGHVGKIAWDSNEKSLDGFNPELGWIRVDLTKLYHIHRVYELKRRRVQSKASKKPSLRKVLQKYSSRERNRVRDFIHKTTTFLAEEFKGYMHGFEKLRKEGMFTRSSSHNRNIAKSDWKTIVSFMGYKANTKLLNPHNSTKRCSRCGMINAPKGASYECRCGLRMDRQLNACLNLYLQMEGLTPSPKLFDGLVEGWRGFALTGGEADEGFDEPTRSPRLVNPKGHVAYKRLLNSEPLGLIGSTLELSWVSLEWLR